jgi:hypothetical protein
MRPERRNHRLALLIDAWPRSFSQLVTAYASLADCAFGCWRNSSSSRVPIKNSRPSRCVDWRRISAKMLMASFEWKSKSLDCYKLMRGTLRATLCDQRRK